MVSVGILLLLVAHVSGFFPTLRSSVFRSERVLSRDNGASRAEAMWVKGCCKTTSRLCAMAEATSTADETPVVPVAGDEGYSFIRDELRQYAMQLHTKDQSPKEGQQPAQAPVKDWTPSLDNYMAFLTDSLAVYGCMEEVVSSKPALAAAFSDTGLERTTALKRDIAWLSQGTCYMYLLLHVIARLSYCYMRSLLLGFKCGVVVEAAKKTASSNPNPAPLHSSPSSPPPPPPLHTIPTHIAHTTLSVRLPVRVCPWHQRTAGRGAGCQLCSLPAVHTGRPASLPVPLLQPLLCAHSWRPHDWQKGVCVSYIPTPTPYVPSLCVIPSNTHTH